MKKSSARTPPTSYGEMYRRHRVLLFVPVILGALAAAAIAFTATKTYTSTASLWIDTSAPTASSIGPAGTASSTPPAPAEQGILSELLTTPAFAISVANHSLLGKRLGSEAAIVKNAPALLGNGKVVPTVTGNQVLQISYTGSSAPLTQSVLAAVVSQLQSYAQSLGTRHGRATVAYYQEQVKIARNLLANARTGLATYLAQHPNAKTRGAVYAALVATVSNANNQLEQENTDLSQARASSNSVGWTIHPLDAASPAVSSKKSKRKIVELILGGALAGLLVSLLAVVLMAPAVSEPWEDETSNRYAPSSHGSSTTSVPTQRESRRGLPSGQGRLPYRHPSDRAD